jgi:hypothetical protein
MREKSNIKEKKVKGFAFQLQKKIDFDVNEFFFKWGF